MGRQAYLTRLALGRSPYEAPDHAEVDPSNPVRRISNIHADNYMQQYDIRGHPVNPESRSLGRDLRRAKNDILSTMGIVVSRENRKPTSPVEQQKIDQVENETDFGLVITTFDQVFVFLGSWWTSSLTGRIQTYKHYAHSALLDVIKFERDTMGFFRFHFAGIPAWAMSSGLALARENPLRRVFIPLRDYVQSLTGNSQAVRRIFGLVYTVARQFVLMLSVEFYMYSTLQSLALVSPVSIPGIHLLLPFGRESLLQLPQLPTDFSPHSLGTWAVGLLTSPGVLVYLYGYYLRPGLEERIYRLIRRHLPKPALPDELSVRIAYEDNLIEWVVPTLGRRSDEELHRAKLTLLEDIKYELAVFRRWVSSIFGLRSTIVADDPARQLTTDERIENLRNSIRQLQNELDGVHIDLGEQAPSDPVARPPGVTPETQLADDQAPRIMTVEERMQLLRRSTEWFPPPPPDGLPTDLGEQAPSDPVARSPSVTPDTQLAATAARPRPRPRPQDSVESTHSRGNSVFGLNQVLTNEDRMSESPGEMSNDYFSGIATAGPTRNGEAISNMHDPQHPTDHLQNGEPFAVDRQLSRSNTLFSRSSSPESSPPTSPRVRASLIHQSSDVITMQLELLGNRNLSPQQQASTLARLNALTGNNVPNATPDPTDRGSIAESLEAFLISQAQAELERRRQQQLQPTAGIDTDGLTSTAAGPSTMSSQVAARYPAQATQDTGLPTLAPIGEALPSLESIEEALQSLIPPNPPVPEESNHEDPHDEPLPVTNANQDDPVESALPPLTSGEVATPFHRVTLLSTYPVDSLASHLSATITGILLAPLEALYLRSLTRSWVMSHPSCVSSASNLHPVGLWFGGRSWSDMGAYSYRLVLMRGMQVAVRVGVWWFLVGSTMRIGRKFCGWGTL
ncbi:uncharacterized protein N7515_002434 [Penicillium bovifimosum]|uniref:Uncharacterized protein n=1 Tax=Penicillium bovifimosum TaxID=126998 RepID=A0A9W9HBL2_9EURO|nr:uncharacterized protein N7515_002434 [Penicillium bovifimosum]KAJ5143647.1 hypothetical protein N7515_002434 [Penicillium bovifimosum]